MTSLRRWTVLTALTLVAMISIPTIAAAAVIEVEAQTATGPVDLRAAAPPPLRLAEGLLAAPVAELAAAREGAVDQLAALRAWNAAGNLPVRTGVVRPLPLSRRVSLDRALFERGEFVERAGGWSGPTASGELAWGTWLRVAEAYRMRARLSAVSLPEGTRLWVWGANGETRSFGLELRDEHGDLWTPSVPGGELFLEVALPGGELAEGSGYGFTLSDVAETFRLDADGSALLEAGTFKLGECITSATCTTSGTFAAIESVRSSIAQLEFLSGSSSYVCTGQLINDTNTSTVVPYLLTANHCIDTSSEASSLEATWDVRPTSCGGGFPSSFPVSNGSALLVSSSPTDVTLLQLGSFPGTRTLLGWTTASQSNGTTLHRISHPYVEGQLYTQSYSRSVVSTGFTSCDGAARPSYLYSIPNIGGTFGGSSGSALMQSDGKIVGQLRGGCGPNPSDGCDYSNADVDGAFAQSYPVLQSYLNPTTPVPCVPSSTTLCVDNNPGDRRFQITVTYSTVQGGGLSGNAHAISLSSLGVTKGGLFWFFGADNPELLVKVLNACGINNRFWIFLTAGTNVGFTALVTDTVTGLSRPYSNTDLNPHVPVQDTGIGLPCN